MTHARDLDTISPEEFAAYLDQLDRAEKPQTPEQIWRAAYREEQRRKRILGYQPDLLDGDAFTHFRRNRAAPEFERPPIEEIDAKLARIKGDRLATFGPSRADRPAFLNDEQKAAVISGAANRLYVSQRVRIVDGPGPVDPQYGPYRFIGRDGVVWRLCSSVFADHCRVLLDPVGAERAEKIVFIEIRDIEPLASSASTDASRIIAPPPVLTARRRAAGRI